MKLPKQTGEIFELLSKGQFICSNSSNERTRKLYDIIDNKENRETLEAYYLHINFILEKGEEFYYFSRNHGKADLERKINAVYKWIDLVDFFKAYDSTFSSGYRFAAADILVSIRVDAVLSSKLKGLENLTKEKNQREIVEKMIKMLCDSGFAELEVEVTQSYKVLTSFKFLEDLINHVHIPEEIQHEIPE